MAVGVLCVEVTGRDGAVDVCSVFMGYVSFCDCMSNLIIIRRIIRQEMTFTRTKLQTWVLPLGLEKAYINFCP